VNPAGITEDSLAVIAEIPTLEELVFWEAWLTYDKGLVHLKKLPKLKKLNLTNTILSEADLAKLKVDLPNTEIIWKPSDDKTTASAKERFEKLRNSLKK
jgi:hypothetical protein